MGEVCRSMRYPEAFESLKHLSPAGRLVLSVSRDTYEMLGLPGRMSAFGALGQRYRQLRLLINPLSSLMCADVGLLCA